MTRNKELDAAKGLLIILVVFGHSGNKMLHDVIFLFHMPLFFMISGMLISKEHLAKRSYFLTRIKRLMIPYYIYGMIDILIFRQDLGGIVRLIWGGRSISGVYWYITCLLFAILIFRFLLCHFTENIVCKFMILLGGGSGN